MNSERERRWVAGRYEDARDAVLDDAVEPARGAGHDRHTGRHGLGRCQPERLAS